MKNILEELWYGNISPHEEKAQNTPRIRELSRELCLVQKELLVRLEEKDRALFTRFSECENEMYALYMADAFARGFSLGVRLFLASFTENG